MTPEYKPRERHLVIGEQTKDLQVGLPIKIGEPSVKRLTIKEVKDSGLLIVEEYDLIKRKVNFVAPMVLGTPIIVLEEN